MTLVTSATRTDGYEPAFHPCLPLADRGPPREGDESSPHPFCAVQPICSLKTLRAIYKDLQAWHAFPLIIDGS